LRDISCAFRVSHNAGKGDRLVVAERERIEEELRTALETARASYRLSMANKAPASFHKEASRRFREALERFHRFVLNGVIPEDLRDRAQ
jgi:hypothetical protein